MGPGDRSEGNLGGIAANDKRQGKKVRPVRRDAVSYREVNRAKPMWIWPILIFVTGMIWYGFYQQIVAGQPFGDNPGPDWVVWVSWLLAGVGLPVFIFVARVIVTVGRDDVTVRWFPLKTRRVPLADIESCEVRKYRPILEYGGWGIRYGGPDRGWAYTLSGNRGVFVRNASGKHLLIGSESPQRLAAAIDAARAGH